MQFRRLADTAAGAIIATAILAGGVAFAAGEDRGPGPAAAPAGATVVDDNPTGDDPGAPGTTVPGSSSTSSPSSTSSTSSTSTTVPAPPAQPPSPLAPYDVAGVATVTVVRDGAVLRFASIEPAEGWRTVVERDAAREIEVSFRSATARVDFNAELEDGEVRTRVVDGRTTAAPGTTTPSTPSTSAPAGPEATTHTITSAGGQVTVLRRGSSVTLVAATPAAGWSADVRHRGPDKVEVRFEDDRRESRIELEVEHGELRRRVEDR